MIGFVMVVIWKVVKSGRVCAGTRILLSLYYLSIYFDTLFCIRLLCF